MKNLLAFCLPVLLLISCGKTDKQLTLIFENAPENSRAIYHSDSVSFAQKENTVKQLYYFTPDRWIEEYIPEGVNDTLRVACSSNTHIEFYHKYRLQTTHYALLQVGDTVYVRYEDDGTPVYRSSISNELTTLYNGDILVFGKPPARFRDGLYYNIERNISLEDFEKNNGKLSYSYTPIDSLLDLHNKKLLVAEAKIDSLININVIAPEYQQYYSYRLKRQELEPEIIRLSVLTSVTSSLLGQEICHFFNDDYCNNISYWHTVGTVAIPMLKEDGTWEPPLMQLADGEKIFDDTAIFDRLDVLADDVPPVTLNMMRYSSLMNISWKDYEYPLEIQQKYFDKYRRHTTDFLIPDYVPVGDTMGFPFRFFIFLLEFIVCTGAFFYIYQLLLKDKVGFLTSRIYLLAALVFSAVIPLLALPVHIAMLPDSALFWNGMLDTALQLMFYVYLFGCLYILTSFVWQLYSIRKMQKESWCIPGDDYNLYILTDIKVRPFAFFSNIFFSWHDWWDIESKKDRDQLLAHEEAHVRLWHSLDNLLIMLGRILYWANPLLLAYGKELRRINEFAADRAVTRLYGVESYINALKVTDTNFMKMEGLLVNNNEEDFAERFSKIQAKAKPWYKNCRLLIIVPLISLLMLLFSSELLVNLGKLPDAFNLPW